MMQKQFYKVESFGKEYDVTLRAAEYVDGGTAIILDYMDEDYHCLMPFATLTVNLGRQNYGYAYVDINNCPWAENFIQENGLGEFAGKWCSSGFCAFPLYKFDMEKIGGADD